MLPTGYKTTAECWQQYPRLPFPDSISRGAAQKRARNACIAASMRGNADPELAVGPPILRDPDALWRTAPPWKARPVDTTGQVFRVVGRVLDPAGVFGGIKTDGDFLRSQALGWRPGPAERFRDIEHKATIAGGIDVLAARGYAPWSSLQGRLTALPPFTLKNDASTLPLLGIVRDAARGLSQTPPSNLAAAANLVRAAVVGADLTRPAWYARGLRLLAAALVAQKKRQVVETAVSTTLAATGAALSSTGVGAIIGLPLAATSAAFSGAGARSAVEESRTQAAYQRMQSELDFELARQNLQQQLGVMQANALNSVVQGAGAFTPELRVEAEQTAKTVQIVVWGTTLSLVTVTALLVARRLSRRTP